MPDSKIADRAVSEPPLNAAELARYDRHLSLPEVGLTGQARLKAARVLMIGTGGLGSPVGLYLAAAGVGCLGIVDFDRVDESNLQRQIMHGGKDVGRLKTESARDRLSDLNPFIELVTHDVALTSANALELIAGYDIVVDGTDNFATRYLVNDACSLLGKPNVYGSIFRFSGQVSVFHTKAGGSCYRCLHPEPPPAGLVPSCAEGGVLGVLPGVIGTLQATEVVKLILQVGSSLQDRLLLFDALRMRFQEIGLKRDPDCALCGDNPTITALVDYQEFCGRGKSADDSDDSIAPDSFLAAWREGQRPLLLDVREPHEWQVANLANYGARLLPLGQLKEQTGSLEPDQDIVVYCKVGGRGAKAQAILRQAGFSRVKNLTGGFDAWPADGEFV